MRVGLVLPNSISEEKLKIDWKMEDLQADAILVQVALGSRSSLHQNGPACRSSIFQSISNFSSEMESGNISPPLIACQLRNSKFLKNSITLLLIYLVGTTYIHQSHSYYVQSSETTHERFWEWGSKIATESEFSKQHQILLLLFSLFVFNSSAFLTIRIHETYFLISLISNDLRHYKIHT